MILVTCAPRPACPSRTTPCTSTGPSRSPAARAFASRSTSQRRFGRRIPKQYCCLLGNRSMLEHTLERMNKLTPAVAHAHGDRHATTPTSRTRSSPVRRDHVFRQPSSRDTGLALYVALAMIKRWTPNAIVTITPTDHYVAPSAQYVEQVRAARGVAARMRDMVVILGAQADRARSRARLPLARRAADRDPPGAPAGRLRREAVGRARAKELAAKGALWNTMVTCGDRRRAVGARPRDRAAAARHPRLAGPADRHARRGRRDRLHLPRVPPGQLLARHARARARSGSRRWSSRASSGATGDAPSGSRPCSRSVARARSCRAAPTRREARIPGHAHVATRGRRPHPVPDAACGPAGRIRSARSFDGYGTNFAVFTSVADARRAVPVRRRDARRAIELTCGIGQIWHAYLPEVGPGTRYGFRVHGPWDPTRGLRCNPHKLLVDPYARAISEGLRWGPALRGHVDDRLARRPEDSAPHTFRSVVVQPYFDWGNDRRLEIPWNETVIYEAHVKGFTMRHPDVPAQRCAAPTPGSRTPRSIAHLKSLGVTAVELLPIHAFVHDGFLLERGPAQLLGLPHDRLLRAAPRVRERAQPRAARSPSSSTWCARSTSTASR